MKGRVLDRTALAGEVVRRKASGQKIVFTNGCFDLLHAGHIRYLVSARAMGDALVVGVNSDESVRGLKGPGRPIQPEAERAEILAGLRAVDLVTVFGEPDPAALVRAVVPDVLVKGGDYQAADVVGRDTVEAAGGRVATVALVPGRSSTDLVQRADSLAYKEER